MFLYRVRLCTLFGIAVNVDASWLILGVLIGWTLGAFAFPALVPGLHALTYWIMAAATALGLLGSILFHEMAHALVAGRVGIPIRSITLFIFGGVAEMDTEPPTARGELLMAVAGPVASLFLAWVFVMLLRILHPVPALAGVLWDLGVINGMLAMFNLVPAFPLDGGRVLRAVLWLWRGDFAWATRIASRLGSGFGFLLIAFGVYRVVTGDFVNGMWLFLIGLFLRAAAAASYRQAMVGRALAGLTVADVMNPSPIVVRSDISIAELVEGYVYARHHRWFPVVKDGILVGSVSTREAAGIERELWPSVSVARIMVPPAPDALVSPEMDLMAALRQLGRSGQSRLMVVRGRQLVGLLSSRDILNEIVLRQELARR
jgi:Zn-dependent protease/predicted transcriptional regulator